MTAKPIIAVDIDDVLAANAVGFVAFSNDRWDTNLTVDDYQEHWGELWQVDAAEVGRRSTELHSTDLFMTYEHYQEAVSVLTTLRQRYRLVCATSRRRQVEQLTRDWITQYFPGIFEEIYFAGIYDRAITEKTFHKTKGEVLTAIQADYLIDDQLKHCLAAAEQGVQAILFGDYSWNRTNQLPRNVRRCADWIAVGEFFDGTR